MLVIVKVQFLFFVFGLSAMREPKEMGYCGKMLGRDLPAFVAWGVIEAVDSKG